MFPVELASPYTNNEEYAELTSAYISANWLLGFEYGARVISPVNEYLLTIDDGYEGALFESGQSMYDIFETVTGMRASIIVNPTPSTVEDCGVGFMHEKEKTVEELFKEEYEACEATDISQVPIDDFIYYCEELYKMKTDVFLDWFEKRNNEGNVDMQMWALYAQNQKKNSGVSD
jgi:hypothetical protein